MTKQGLALRVLSFSIGLLVRGNGGVAPQDGKMSQACFWCGRARAGGAAAFWCGCLLARRLGRLLSCIGQAFGRPHACTSMALTMDQRPCRFRTCNSYRTGVGREAPVSADCLTVIELSGTAQCHLLAERSRRNARMGAQLVKGHGVRAVRTCSSCTMPKGMGSATGNLTEVRGLPGLLQRAPAGPLHGTAKGPGGVCLLWRWLYLRPGVMLFVHSHVPRCLYYWWLLLPLLSMQSCWCVPLIALTVGSSALACTPLLQLGTSLTPRVFTDDAVHGVP